MRYGFEMNTARRAIWANRLSAVTPSRCCSVQQPPRC